MVLFSPILLELMNYYWDDKLPSLFEKKKKSLPKLCAVMVKICKIGFICPNLLDSYNVIFKSLGMEPSFFYHNIC